MFIFTNKHSNEREALMASHKILVKQNHVDIIDVYLVIFSTFARDPEEIKCIYHIFEELKNSSVLRSTISMISETGMCTEDIDVLLNFEISEALATQLYAWPEKRVKQVIGEMRKGSKINNKLIDDIHMLLKSLLVFDRVIKTLHRTYISAKSALMNIDKVKNLPKSISESQNTLGEVCEMLKG